jgi:hypothetical protein
MARCHARLAIVHARMTQRDGAEDHLAHARRMYVSIGMRHWLARLDALTAKAASAS